jgi:TrwC relaxase
VRCWRHEGEEGSGGVVADIAKLSVGRLLHREFAENHEEYLSGHGESPGRWTALDGRDLYRHRLAGDAIYRAAYQRELAWSLGVEWTAADSYGNRELQGMPEALVYWFSKRTDRIGAGAGLAGRRRSGADTAAGQVGWPTPLVN